MRRPSSKLVAISVATAVLGLTALATYAYNDAMVRALVLGKARGAAEVCQVPLQDLIHFDMLAEDNLREYAPDPSKLQKAKARMMEEAANTKRLIAKGYLSCDDAKRVYEKQYDWLLYRLRQAATGI